MAILNNQMVGMPYFQTNPFSQCLSFNMCGLLPHCCWSIPTSASSILVEQGQVEPFSTTLIFLEKRPDQLIVSRSLKYTMSQFPPLFGIIIFNKFHTVTFLFKRPHPRFWDWRHKPQILKPTYHVWSPKPKLNDQSLLPKHAENSNCHRWSSRVNPP